MNLRLVVVSIISVSLLSAGLGAGPLAVLPVAAADPADSEPPFDRGPVDAPTVDARPLSPLDPVPDAADEVTGLTGDVELPEPAATEVTVDESWTDVSGMPVEVQVDESVDPETPEAPEGEVEPGDTVEVELTRPASLEAGLLLQFETTDTADDPVEDPTQTPDPSPTPEPSETPPPSDPTDGGDATPGAGEPAAEETEAPTPTEPTSAPMDDPTDDPSDDPADPAGEPVGANDVEVRVSYAGFVNAFGGGWADRLQVRAYPACFAETPEDAACATGVPVEATNDPGAQELTFTTIAASEIDAAGADDDAGVEPSARESDPADEPVGSPVFLLAAGPGNYAAKPVSPSAGWQVGPGSGEFGYSYPFELPPATTGTTPSLSIDYSSSAVDGAPSQASPVGVGWADLSPGYITRSYVSCDDDVQMPNTPSGTPGAGRDDLCWRTQRDDEGDPLGPPVEEYLLVLNGKSSPLIKTSESPSGGRTRYRLRDDSGWRVTKYQHATPDPDQPDNADNDNEGFKVETPDGMEYWFGFGRGTNSVWTVPVFGNDEDSFNNEPEPCWDATIEDAWCQQGWRWNLDRVTDTLDNLTKYSYSTEANNYLRWGTTKTPYDRAGALETVEYGYAKAPSKDPVAHQEIEIDTDDRCTPKIQGGSDCTPGPGENAWPDVPQDLVCEGSQTCTSEAPAFFTDQRYTTVTTRTYEGTDPMDLTPRVVDEYVLEHTMPDPDAGGAGRPELWLNEVTRTGHGAGNTTTSLPPVQFDNGPNPGLPGLVKPIDTLGDWESRRFRIESVRNETGGRIEVTYGHSGDEDPNDSRDMKCVANDVDGWERWESVKECFGLMWVPPGEEEDELGWFHKYVVTTVALGDDALGYSLAVENELDPTSLGSLRVYDYIYENTPAWRYVPSPNTLNTKETWTDFRGYGVTRILTRNVEDQDVVAGNSSVQRIVRYRGMTGSPISAPVTDSSPRWGPDDWRLETDEPGDGSPGPVDEKWLNGLTAETSLLQPGGSLINRSYTAYDTVQTAEDIDTEGGHQARIRFATSSTTTTAVTGSPDRTRTMTYTVDDGGSDPMSILVGTVLRTDDHVANASGGQPDYTEEPDTCTTTDWISNTSDVDWIRANTRTRLYESTCVGLDPQEDEPLTETLNLYDGSTAGAQTLSEGLLTGVDTATGTGDPISTRTEYDDYGRVIATIDGNGNRTETDYANPGSLDPDHDLVTRVTVTEPTVDNDAPLSDITLTNVTDLDPRRGLPTTVTDPNNRSTTVAYNGLGQPTEVTLPGNPTSHPNFEYTYTLDPDGNSPSRVHTKTLREQERDPESGLKDGEWQYDNTTTFYDGWGRQIESQALVPKNSAPPVIPQQDGRIVSATGYDSQGQVRYQMPAVANEDENLNQLLNADPEEVVRYTKTDYDAAGRPITVAEMSYADDINTVTTTYTGDKATTDPQVGGDTVTHIDHRGRTSKVSLNPGAGVAGSDQAEYTYTPTGQLEDISKLLGAQTFHWKYGYDMAGRKLWATDPDTGGTIYGYDANSNLTQTVTTADVDTTDPYDPGPLGSVISTIDTTYDELNRPRSRADSGNTPLLTEWHYDQPAAAAGDTAAVPNSLGRLVRIDQNISTINLLAGDVYYTTRVAGYDQRGNRTSTSDEYPVWLTNEPSGTGGAPASRVRKTTSYTYNQADLLATTTYPAEANLPAQTVSNDYTNNSAFMQMLSDATTSNEQLLAWQTYNNVGQIKDLYSSSLDSPALLREYGYYHETGRIHTLFGSDRDSTIWYPFAFEYTQDKNGNPLRIRGATQASAGATQLHGAWCYTYDQLQRLSTVRVGVPNTGTTDGCFLPNTTSNQVTGTPYQLTYGYNADRLASVNATGTTQTVNYTFDPDHPHQTTQIAGVGTAAGLPTRASAINYDDLGRVENSTHTGAVLNRTDYEYDKLGQLKSANITAVGTNTYAYHADGTRFAHRRGLNTIVYRSDGTELTKPASGQLTAVRNFSTPDGIPVASRTGAGWTWLMADPHNTIRLSKNPASTYTRYNYFPHGGPSTGNPPNTPGSRGYLNKTHDHNGDIRLDQRHYTPTLNILTTPDPILEPGDPQSANPYAYARNNPIAFVDPSGLAPTCGANVECAGQGGIGGTADDPVRNLPDNGDNGGWPAVDSATPSGTDDPAQRNHDPAPPLITLISPWDLLYEVSLSGILTAANMDDLSAKDLRTRKHIDEPQSSRLSRAEKLAKRAKWLGRGFGALGLAGVAATGYNELTRESEASKKERVANIGLITLAGTLGAAAATSLAGCGVTVGVGCVLAAGFGAAAVATLAAGTLHSNEGWLEGGLPYGPIMPPVQWPG